MVKENSAAPWFFFVFMIIQAMILINMMVTIVTNFFTEVRSNQCSIDDEAELMSMLLNRVRLFDF